MISRYTHHGLTWLDLESPTREELLHISEECNLSKPLEEQLFSEIGQSQLEPYPNFIHLTLPFPQEINFIIGKHFILTVHHEKIESLLACVHLFEQREELAQYKKISDSGILFAEMLQLLYRPLHGELKDINGRISTIERGILQDHGSTAAKALSQTMHALLDFNQRMSSHAEILAAYQTASTALFGESYMAYASSIISRCAEIKTLIETDQKILEELQQTNTSLILLQSARTTQKLIYAVIIGVLAIILFLFLWH